MNLTHGAHTRRYLAASTSLALAIALAGCSGADAGDDVSLGIHAVIAKYAPPIGNADLTAEQGLATIEVEPTESAIATMEWFIAGDCAKPAPVTEEFAAACDDNGTVYLLEPAALTEDDIASAEALEAGGVTVTFTDEAATDLANLTALAAIATAPQNQVAMVVNGVVVSAPVVQEKITGGSVQISSSDAERDWAALATELNG